MMIGSYEDWQNMAVQMRSERDKALDEVDRLKAELAAETKRSEDWIEIAQDHCEGRAKAELAAAQSREYLHSSENIYSGLHQAMEAQLGRVEKLLEQERERYELLAGDYAGADADRQQLAKALEEANALLVRWCTAFSMGPLADIYLRQESKTFLISNYPKHNFHVEPKS
jgi:hypothetical protein